MDKIKLLAYAKINPYLDVVSMRENGYHNIESLMQTVSLCDEITITRDHTHNSINLTCSNKDLPCDRGNLVYRAAEMFMSSLNISEGVNIHIEKNIPFQAGLGGGSADAAATFKGMNEIFGDPYDISALANMGARLGADIPFCIYGGSARVSGIGEVVSQIKSLVEYYAVISISGEGISTPVAFKALDEIHGDYTAYSKNNKLDNIIHACESGDLDGFCRLMFNSFEEVVLPSHSMASKIKSSLLECGARSSVLSGSGPSVIGVFDSMEKAESAVDVLKQHGVNAWLCTPVNL